MGRLQLHEREAVRALWRGHFEAWRLSGLTQREYCERHGLSLKSFGNWRGQLKREDVAGRDARWGRQPRLRHIVSPMATPWPTRLAGRGGGKGGRFKFFSRSAKAGRSKGRPPAPPRRRLLVGIGEAQYGRIVEALADDLKGQRQAAVAKAAAHRHRRAAGHVERHR